MQKKYGQVAIRFQNETCSTIFLHPLFALGRDMRKHVEKRLAARARHQAHPPHHQVPPHRAQPRVGPERGGRQAAARAVRQLLVEGQAVHRDPRQAPEGGQGGRGGLEKEERGQHGGRAEAAGGRQEGKADDEGQEADPQEALSARSLVHTVLVRVRLGAPVRAFVCILACTKVIGVVEAVGRADDQCRVKVI